FYHDDNCDDNVVSCPSASNILLLYGTSKNYHAPFKLFYAHEYSQCKGVSSGFLSTFQYPVLCTFHSPDIGGLINASFLLFSASTDGVLVWIWQVWADLAGGGD
ncbi:hypothetical protein C8R45DRAFT_1213396, partial [Mycena sanguinolenta]